MADEKDISEFWGPRLEGEKIPMKELVDRDIVLIDFETRPSLYHEGKNYALIQIEVDGQLKITTTTGAAVIGSLKYLKEKGGLPGRVKCKVIQKQSTKGRQMFSLASTGGTELGKIGE